MPHILALPNELLQQIIKTLHPIPDLENFTSTCRRLRNNAKDILKAHREMKEQYKIVRIGQSSVWRDEQFTTPFELLREIYEGGNICCYVTELYIGYTNDIAFFHRRCGDEMLYSAVGPMLEYQRRTLEKLRQQIAVDGFTADLIYSPYALYDLDIRNICCAILLLPNLRKVIVWPRKHGSLLSHTILRVICAVALGVAQRSVVEIRSCLLGKLAVVNLQSGDTMSSHTFCSWAGGLSVLPSLRSLTIDDCTRTWKILENGFYDRQKFADSKRMGRRRFPGRAKVQCGF